MDVKSIIMAGLGLAEVIVPMVTKSDQVQKVIDLVEKVVDQAEPAIEAGVDFAKDIGPTVSVLFDVLRNKGATTSAQLEQMDAIEAKLDADFDDAAAKATAEDEAADGKTSAG